MRQAIITKYLGPTDHNGARVKATAQAGSVTIPWDHALNSDENHLKAATALAWKFGWLDGGWKLVGGATPDDMGFAFVIVPPGPDIRWNRED